MDVLTLLSYAGAGQFSNIFAGLFVPTAQTQDCRARYSTGQLLHL